MTSGNFPLSFDVPLHLVDGVDYCDGETINTIIQGAWLCQEALDVDPWSPEVGAHAGAWAFPGASVAESLREFGRIEYGVVKIALPTTTGTIDVYLRHPGRFTRTSTNGVPFIVFVRYLNVDQEEALMESDLWPHSRVSYLYDGSNDLAGFQIKGLSTGTDYQTVEMEYFAMECNW